MLNHCSTYSDPFSPGFFIRARCCHTGYFKSCILFFSLLPLLITQIAFGQAVASQGTILNKPDSVKIRVQQIQKTSGIIACRPAGGIWSAGLTWVGGIVPSSLDDAIIVAGATVTVDQNTAVCHAITITGILAFNAGINLSVNGDWVNNGALNASSGKVTFSGPGNARISGSSASNFNNININKGSDPASVVEANGLGAISNTGNITINNGLFKMTTGIFRFNSSTSIPSSAGIWLNGATLNSSGSFSYTNDGYIKISSGIANFGTAAGNELHNQNKGYLEISGGNVNISGRLVNTAFGITPLVGIPATGMSISAGIVTVCSAGNGANGIGSFDMSTSSVLSMTGGTVIFQVSSTAGIPVDLNIISGGTKNISGGTFQVGNSTTGIGQMFRINSALPVYDFNINQFNAPAASLSGDLTVNNQLTLNGLMYLNNQNLILGASAPAIAVSGSFTTNKMIICNNGVSGGELRKVFLSNGSYSFPVGDNLATPDYSPVTISIITAVAYGGYAGIKVENKKEPNNFNVNNYTNRYWRVSTGGITSPGYDITATYSTADVVGSYSSMVMGKYTSKPWIKFLPATPSQLIATNVNISGPSSSVDFSGISNILPVVNIPSAGVCTGSSYTFIPTVTGDPPIAFAWNSIPAGFISNSPSITVNPVVSTKYTVTITDGNGFIATNSAMITIKTKPSPLINHN